MKCTYVTENGRLTFDCEAETAKDLFSQLGSIQEIFEAEVKCGMCGSVDIRYSFRVVEDYQFYELSCRGCLARFQFGQKKKGGDLFPKRKNEDGHALANGGWARWEPHTESQPMPGPREVIAPKPATDTPEGLQPSFDRLAEIFAWKVSPTRIGSALDQLRDEFKARCGNAGVQRFDRIYRGYENSPAKGSPATVKAMLKDCINALDEMQARPVA